MRQTRHRKRLTLNEYAEGITRANRVVLAQAISLVESTQPQDIELAAQLLESIKIKDEDRVIKLGISGVPGVGKSSLIEAFGNHVVDQGHKLAVLSIDPSSPEGKGSILGDKTRMETLVARPEVIIRPSASSGTVGGLAPGTYSVMRLCMAAGYDFIIVETVGAGQTETALRYLVDCFLLLVQPAGGDELQGIKRGIMEMADIIAVTKADGHLADAAKISLTEYAAAVGFIRNKVPGYHIPVITTSAYNQQGLHKLYALIKAFYEELMKHFSICQYRQEQQTELFKHTATELFRIKLQKSGKGNLQLENIFKQLKQGANPTLLAEAWLKSLGL